MKKILFGLAAGLIAVIAFFSMRTDDVVIVANAGDPEQVAKGKALYQQSCASCHGESLQGETPDWRSQKGDGTLPAPPHDGSGHTWHHGDQLLFHYVKLGGQAIVPSGFKSAMPAFSDRHSDEEIMDILAYIKSSWSPQQLAHQKRASAQERP